uniref:NADP-dependent oxidoreductase domain-containing protein n=1 Tax=Alexandrium monilatum TaxID=311494 RepID=A0A7S4Q141_9DINO|mmetsp:Transcript_34258/g.102373  ORF Transcript_34258/g.102373 Transcript_34258/m.102373 type:complete len:315 (+) Transcript_34258:58-1002(+)
MAEEGAPASVPMVALAPGVDMPALGYGIGTPWFQATGDKVASLKEAIGIALDSGFRHIDEAEMYANSVTTGEALRAWMERTGTPRKGLFLTHKVISVDDPGIVATCRKSLESMGLDYFDLYLIHAPFHRSGEPFKKSLKEAWAEMESLVDAGAVRCIGVSNWRVQDLEEIYESARIKPVCNQVEANPYLQQPALLSYCQARSICVTFYGGQLSLTKEEVKGGPVDVVVEEVAKKHGVTPGQVLLRWGHQTGRVPITTTTKPERMVEYLRIFSFELSAAELDAISVAGRERQRRWFWTQCPQFAEDPSGEADSRL